MDLTSVEEALDVEVDLIFGFNAMVNQNWIVDKANHRLLLLWPKSARTQLRSRALWRSRHRQPHWPVAGTDDDAG
jgi:hypothetical protein